MTGPMSSKNSKEPHVRKRVSRACDFCRLRKTKCNGEKPCSKCVRDNNLCLYTNKKRALSHPPKVGYVQLLERRENILKSSLQKLVELVSKGGSLNELKDSKDIDLTSINEVIEFLTGEHLDGEEFDQSDDFNSIHSVESDNLPGLRDIHLTGEMKNLDQLSQEYCSPNSGEELSPTDTSKYARNRSQTASPLSLVLDDSPTLAPNETALMEGGFYYLRSNSAEMEAIDYSLLDKETSLVCAFHDRPLGSCEIHSYPNMRNNHDITISGTSIDLISGSDAAKNQNFLNSQRFGGLPIVSPPPIDIKEESGHFAKLQMMSIAESFESAFGSELSQASSDPIMSDDGGGFAMLTSEDMGTSYIQL